MTSPRKSTPTPASDAHVFDAAIVPDPEVTPSPAVADAPAANNGQVQDAHGNWAPAPDGGGGA